MNILRRTSSSAAVIPAVIALDKDCFDGQIIQSCDFINMKNYASAQRRAPGTRPGNAFAGWKAWRSADLPKTHIFTVMRKPSEIHEEKL
jgi:hypothetical protein